MKVLIALDESAASARAARAATRLFAPVPGSEFLVINVSRVPAPWVGGAGFGTVTPLGVDPEWLTHVGEDSEHEVDLMARAQSIGVPEPEPLVRAGDPVTEICRAAADHHVDVIVVGSHDKTALRRLFDPSVATGVVRGTSVPVLVVSGHADEES